jgi:predicted sulfurtransferase
MLVRLKKEIIAFGVEGIDPARRTSPKLSARELKQWLDEGRPVTLLDTRNDYEVRLGTFRHALPIGVDHFRDFPAAVRRLPDTLKEQPIVMFCTGGIRCEKAGPFMEREGFRQIYQLDGGILKYFEECGGAHYDGECFVFDQRVGVDPALHETDSVVCFGCQSPLTEAEQEDPRYVPGRTCPYCFQTPWTARSVRCRAACLTTISARSMFPKPATARRWWTRWPPSSAISRRRNGPANANSAWCSTTATSRWRPTGSSAPANGIGTSSRTSPNPP